MIQFLSEFFYACLRAEKKKNDADFLVDKEKRFIDQLIIFMIVISAFVVVGLLFGVLTRIHYLFYMLFLATNISYSVSLYLESKKVVLEKELHVSVFHAIFMRVMVFLNLTSLLGVLYSFFVYSPFLGLIDQIILLFLSIISSLLLILRDSNSSIKRHDMQKNIYRLVLILPTHYFIMYALPITNLAFTIIFPVLILLLLFVIKYYLIPIIFLEERFRLPIAITKTFLITISIFGGFLFSNFYANQIDDGQGLYYFQLKEEKVCDVTIDSRLQKDMILHDDYYFIQSTRTTRVYDSNCLLVESIEVEDPHIMFELEGDVALLSHIEIDETLEENYKAYELYIFDGNAFVKERIVYQYGYKPSELFIYNNQLSYLLKYNYHVVDYEYIPYIQSYNDGTNYGIDHRISEDVIHYQDDDTLIFKSNGLKLQSKFDNSLGSSFLYSNEYTLFFEHNTEGDGYIPTINTVEGSLHNNDQNKIRLSKKELGINGNVVEGFHYLNDQFYIYVNQTMFIYDHQGNLLKSITRFPVTYQFMNGDLYIFSDTETHSISKIDLNDPGEYLAKKNIFLKQGQFDMSGYNGEIYQYNLHYYPIYINYIVLSVFVFMIVIKIDFLKSKN